MYGNIKLIIKKITMWYILLFIIGGIIISYLTYKPKPKEKTFKEKFEEELIKRNYDIEFI
jgi:preprotein translocase subunit SecG